MDKLPPALLSSLTGAPGFEQEPFLAAHAQPAPVAVRRNEAKANKLFADAAPVPWCPTGAYLPQRPVFTLDPLFHAGGYYVQEASSMFVYQVVKAAELEGKPLRVLDLCAAPGGKSTLLASLLTPDSLLVSNDVIRTRATILEENMTRWGHMNTWVTCNDPRDFSRLPGYFDVILVDAPCSGSGLIRKDPTAADEWSEANVKLCSERQQRILAEVWPALKENGILIYATCSYSVQENEQILDWLSTTYNASSVALQPDTNWGIVPSVTRNGMHGYRFYPHKVAGEGFFIAAIRKSSSANTLKASKVKVSPDKKMHAQASYLMGDGSFSCMAGPENAFYAIHPKHEADWQLLKSSLYIRKAGITLGMPGAKEWVPAHDVALSIHTATNIPYLDATYEQALRFLKREDMGVQLPEKGWYLVRYQGLGLGWVKCVGNRMNNYLPMNWRIRMDISQAL